LEQRYTESEVRRMLGIESRQLTYWTRLRLVAPRSRWGTRFYSFSDLVSLETIRRLSDQRVPMRKLHRAIAALEDELGQARAPLASLRVSTNGSEVVVRSSQADSRPIEPLTGQFVLDFEISSLAEKVRTMASHSAEEWFEIGMGCDTSPETLEHAVDAYRRALALSPEWTEAHINLGTTLYQLDRMDDARKEFATAVALDPLSALAEFNLGCVLEHDGETIRAIEHLRRAVELSPEMADAHLNLALAYERLDQRTDATRHLSLYLRYDPRGPWAEFARSRIARNRAPETHMGKLTPFRRVR
jgi:tetratricopeptide (TPR) repeat protein